MPSTWVTPRVWTAGERVGASKMNEISTDLNVVYPHTTGGDIAYRDPAGAYLTRLAIGGGTTVLLGGTTPSWTHSPPIAGVLHAKGIVTFSPGGQVFTGGTWTDVTGATFDLTLTQTCTVMVWASVSGYEGTTGVGYEVRAVIGGTADATAFGSLPFHGGLTPVRDLALPYINYRTGVTSGTCTVKLQCIGNSNSSIERGRLMAFAFVE